MARIRVIQFGLGPIGAGVARVIAARTDFQFVGAVDIDPAKVGKDLGRLIGLDHDLGVTISDDAAKVLKRKADVVMHCTSSSLLIRSRQLTRSTKPSLAIRSRA